MNPKKLLIDILASDQRIWDYEKRIWWNKRAENNWADKCINAYKEAIKKFCEVFDEQEADYTTIAEKLDIIIAKLESSGETNSDYLLFK